jgi:hypothetical protein
MDISFWLPVVKVLHLGALVLWLGPSGGAWLVLMLARRRLGEPGVVTHYMYRGFLQMLWFEHLGLLLMLGSGALLLSMYGLSALGMTWLRLKLLLVLAVIIPIEIADMWFSHRRLPEMFATRRPDAPYTREELRLLTLYHYRFTPIALPLLLATIITIMWLALAKPA